MGTCIKIILTQYICLGIFSRVWRRISQSEIRNSAAAESEGGQKFLPPNPLPFCPPERSVSVLPREARQSVGVSFKIGSSFVQQLRPIKTFQIFRGKSLLARPAFGGATL